jgi:hypothetical protein
LDRLVQRHRLRSVQLKPIVAGRAWAARPAAPAWTIRVTREGAQCAEQLDPRGPRLVAACGHLAKPITEPRARDTAQALQLGSPAGDVERVTSLIAPSLRIEAAVGVRQ